MQYQLLLNDGQQASMPKRLQAIGNLTTEYKIIQTAIKDKTAQRKALLAKQASLSPLQFTRSGQISQEVPTLNEDTEELRFRKEQLLLYALCQCAALVQPYKLTSIRRFYRMLVCSSKNKLFLKNPPAGRAAVYVMTARIRQRPEPAWRRRPSGSQRCLHRQSDRPRWRIPWRHSSRLRRCPS